MSIFKQQEREQSQPRHFSLSSHFETKERNSPSTLTHKIKHYLHFRPHSAPSDPLEPALSSSQTPTQTHPQSPETTDITSHFPFLALPLELRQQIYIHVLGGRRLCFRTWSVLADDDDDPGCWQRVGLKSVDVEEDEDEDDEGYGGRYRDGDAMWSSSSLSERDGEGSGRGRVGCWKALRVWRLVEMKGRIWMRIRRGIVNEYENESGSETSGGYWYEHWDQAWYEDWCEKRRLQKRKGILEVLLVSRQIYTESYPYIFTHNTFTSRNLNFPLLLPKLFKPGISFPTLPSNPNLNPLSLIRTLHLNLYLCRPQVYTPNSSEAPSDVYTRQLQTWTQAWDGLARMTSLRNLRVRIVFSLGFGTDAQERAAVERLLEPLRRVRIVGDGNRDGSGSDKWSLLLTLRCPGVVSGRRDKQTEGWRRLGSEMGLPCEISWVGR